MTLNRICRHVRAAARLGGVAVLFGFAAGCASSDSGWETLSVEGDPFTIEAPGKSKMQDISEQNRDLGAISGRQYSWYPPSNRFYLAMYMTISNPNGLALDTKNAMKSMVDGVSRRSGGTIISEKPVMMAGIEGVETEIKMGSQPGRMRVRSAERNRTFYLLVVGWPEGQEFLKDENRFFDSFHMK